MDLQRDKFNKLQTEFSKEFTVELKRRFKILESETGVDDDVELKKQLLYNMLFGIVLDVENEMEGDKDIAVINEAIDDYDSCYIDDVRSKYFNYLYNTDTKLF